MAINLEGGIGLKPTIVSDVPNLSSLSFRSQYELCLKFFFWYFVGAQNWSQDLDHTGVL